MKDNNYSQQYINTIRTRFPEFAHKSHDEIILALNTNKEKDNMLYSSEFPRELSSFEKEDYFSDFDGDSNTTSAAEKLSQELSLLPWKQVPEKLGNNYVVGIPGSSEGERKDYVIQLFEKFQTSQAFLSERNTLPHYKNVFLFTLPQDGGSIPEHHHEQEARLFILDGSTKDIHNHVVGAGTMVINKPGERHGYLTGKGQKLLALSWGADDGILEFDSVTGEYTGIKDFIH